MNFFPKNVGSTDCIIRISASVVLAGLTLYVGQQSLWVAVGLGAMAAILLATAFAGTCPLYLPFGISTRQFRKLR